MSAAKYHLLLVDDDPEERYLMHLALADIGWENAFRSFSSAEKFLHYLTQLPADSLPSLILLDYNMPGMNGAELLGLLKKSLAFRHLRVALYSSVMIPELEQRLLQGGAIRCFAKAQHYADAIALAESLRQLATAGYNS